MYRQLPAWSPLPGAALRDAVLQTLRPSRDPRPRLETLLRDRGSASGVRLCASGTHALRLAFESIREAGVAGAILLPAYTCYEVATAAVGAGVHVALYDIDPATLAPDSDSVRRAARSSVVAAFVVAPLYGVPVDWVAMRALANELGAILIEDAAQAQGASFQDRPGGSHGDLSVLSFGRGKGWTGMGGGALLWRGAGDDVGRRAAHAALEPATSADDLRTIVRAKAQWLLARPAVYGVPASIPALALGETIYHPPTPLREMGRAAASIALASARAAEDEAAARRGNATEYRADLPIIDNIVDGGVNGALRAPMLRAGGWRDVRATEAARLGAGPPYPTTLGALQALQPFLENPEALHPGADQIVAELLTLPTHSRTRAAERRRLVSLLGRGTDS